jgi:hypothetical protein
MDILLPDPLPVWTEDHRSDLVVVLRSDRLGDEAGSVGLGRQLVQTFLASLSTSAKPPQAMLFYGSAIRLALPDSPVLLPLRQMAGQGTDLLLCQISCQTLAPGAAPAVGRLADWHELTELMCCAGRLLWP